MKDETKEDGLPVREHRVHVIAIGDELLSAGRLDTNSHEIQDYLLEIGLKVGQSHVVADDVEEIKSVLLASAKKAGFIITSGGLGPTEDDVTRAGVASAAGVALREDPTAFADIERFFRERGRALKESNRRQALIPEGGAVIPNPMGTAPAFTIPLQGTPIYCLPGVPAEMRHLMKESVVPMLKEALGEGQGTLVRSKVFLIGLTESSVNDRIKDLLEGSDPRVGITVTDSVISIRLVSEGPQARGSVDRAKQRLREIFGDRIFAEEGEGKLENVVGNLLIDRGITIALAESCTGGLLSHLITQVPGISGVYIQGAVTYAGEAKTRLLGLSEALMAEHGQVSREVAEAMARGAADRAGTRAGIGITGIAGPGGGTKAKPVGLVHMAVCLDGRIRSREYRFSGDREMIKSRAAHLALELLRRSILGLD
jgi:nicotinamide-nucleotide amidase